MDGEVCRKGFMNLERWRWPRGRIWSVAEFNACGVASSPVESIRKFPLTTSRAVTVHSPGVKARATDRLPHIVFDASDLGMDVYGHLVTRRWRSASSHGSSRGASSTSTLASL